MNRWLMPQELPVVACRLLKESAEVPLHELTQAAKEVSSKALGSRWSSREHHARWNQFTGAYPELRQVQLDTCEGLIAGLGYALTRLFFARVEALCVQVVHKSPWSSVKRATSQVATEQGKKQHETSPHKTQHNQNQHKKRKGEQPVVQLEVPGRHERVKQGQ